MPIAILSYGLAFGATNMHIICVTIDPVSWSTCWRVVNPTTMLESPTHIHKVKQTQQRKLRQP